MYNGKVEVPLVIRTTAGGGRGYGPTHSQCMEKFFMGVPGLKVICPSIFHNPGALLLDCIINEKEPVLYIEYKGLYSKEIQGDRCTLLKGNSGDNYPVAKVMNYDSGAPDIIILSYGGLSLLLLDILSELEGEEIKVKALFCSHINRLYPEEIIHEFNDTNKIMILEESTEGFGWGSQMAAFLYARLFGKISAPIQIISSGYGVIPAAKQLESQFLPSKTKIINSIIEALK